MPIPEHPRIDNQGPQVLVAGHAIGGNHPTLMCEMCIRDRRFRITQQNLQKYLGVPRYRSSRIEERDEVGLSNGLAVTMFGGELLATEVSVVPGKGKLVLTGKLGEVMQESAQAAMSYVRSRADALGLERDFYQKVDVHVHFPEGAVPKDGPSAGITMVTSLVSALLRLPVRRDVAMTGEVTPVSYTHLDVYKRQSLGTAPSGK